MRSLNTVVRINLNSQEYSFLTLPKVSEYIGGEVAATFLALEHYKQDPDKTLPYLSINTGPFNGIFPYTSKGYIMYIKSGKDTSFVGGGKIASLMNFSNILSIEIVGKSTDPIILDISPRAVKFIKPSVNSVSSLGIAGRRSSITFLNEIICDEYFLYGESKEIYKDTNLMGLNFSTDSELAIPDIENYNEIYKSILEKESMLSVSRGSNPSCFGCPMGCAFSKNAETANVSILPRSLISCAFAEPIYSDVNTVFACFSVLGMGYNHEFLETFSARSAIIKKELDEIL
jgi:aldehyde:ferredoxin oxidoreductase